VGRWSFVRHRPSSVGGVAPPKGLFLGGVKLPLALAELGLIDEYEFVVQPRLAGHGPTLFAGLSKHIDLKLVSRLEFGSGAVAMRYEPRR
jgi:riboflavin biosynthesis pyrimidine reductase